MKKIIKIPRFFGFILAIGLAIGTQANSSIRLQKYGKFLGGCNLGTLNEVNCGPIPWNHGQCTITLGFQVAPAFDQIDVMGQCSQRLYKRSP